MIYDNILAGVAVLGLAIFTLTVPLALAATIWRQALKVIAVDLIEIYARYRTARFDIENKEVALRLGTLERRRALELNEEQAILQIQERRRALLLESSNGAGPQAIGGNRVTASK